MNVTLLQSNIEENTFHVLQIIYHTVNINRPFFFFVGCDGNVIKWVKS